MRCPQCGADQPGGVTICGFCGAAILAVPQSESAPIPFGAGRAPERRRMSPLWLLGAVVVASAVFLAWPKAKPQAEPPHRSESGAGELSTRPVAVSPEARAPASDENSSPPLAVRAFRGRLTPDGLRGFADELERRAQAGPGSGLADLVDVNVRYQSVVEDGNERRELRGGAPELLAHWQVGWLAGEAGLPVPDDVIAVEEVTVAPSGTSGTVTRRVESTGDVARIAFPRPLLEELARRQPVDAEALGALDLRSLVDRPVDCRSRETIEVSATPIGIRVVAVQRRGDCRPAG